MFKKNESAPEKLPPPRIALIAYVENTLPVDGVTKGIFCTPSTVSRSEIAELLFWLLNQRVKHWAVLASSQRQQVG